MLYFQLNSGLLSNRLSIPSAVLAEASWYGSIRAGWQSETTNDDGTVDGNGVADGFSRWGIKGASEVSEGLSAVYRFEYKIDSSDADQPGGRLSYAGLSGGFGTLTAGQVWSASFNHVGAIFDKSLALGAHEVTARTGSTVSYALDVGNLSVQLDANGNGSDTEKDIDSSQLGATLKIGETGKIAMAYIDRATLDLDNPIAAKSAAANVVTDSHSARGDHLFTSVKEGDVGTGAVTSAVEANPTAHMDSDTQAVLAGEYTIGGMALHLGYGERKWDTDSKTGMAKRNSEGCGCNTCGSRQSGRL